MKNNSYVISSLGRCGSTLITEAIHEKIWEEPCSSLSRETHEFIVSRKNVPENFVNGKVYKTHIHPVDFPENCRVIFTFGNPVDIVVSLMQKSNENERWGWQHFKNFDADWEAREDIITRDILKLEEMFDKYYQKQNFDLICLKYESFWEDRVEEDLSDFLGFEFKMPPKKKRFAPELRKFLEGNSLEDLNTTYSSLLEKVDSAKNVTVW